MSKEQYPIIPDSPESGHLKDLAEYLASLSKDAPDSATTDAAFDRLLALVNGSPLDYEAKGRVRMHFLLARQRAHFEFADLALDERVLSEVLGGRPEMASTLHQERIRQMAAYVRGFVRACVEEIPQVSAEVRMKVWREALLQASPFAHWRVRHFFEFMAAEGKLENVDPETVVGDFNAYWLRCEEEINAVLAPMGGVSPSAQVSEARGAEPQVAQDAPSKEVRLPKEVGALREDMLGGKTKELLSQGETATRAGQHGEALILFKQAWHTDLGNRILRTRIREFYDSLARKEGGLEILITEVERDPHDDLIRTALSTYYVSIGENEIAAKYVNDAIRKDPNAKPEIRLASLERSLKTGIKPKKSELDADQLFKDIPGLDEVSAPIDGSPLSSFAGRIKSGIGELADSLRGGLKKRFSKPAEPIEESITPEMAEAAAESIPDGPRERINLTNLSGKDFERWFQGEVKTVHALAESKGSDFEKGKKALEGGDREKAREWFGKSIQGDAELGMRHAVLNVYREHGLTEMGEAIVTQGMDLNSGSDLMFLGNLFCEHGTVRNYAMAWNYFNRAMKLDATLFRKQDLDALEALMKTMAKEEGVALILMMGREGHVYQLPPLKKSDAYKEKIFSLLESQGVAVDREGQSVEDIVVWLSEKGDLESVRLVIGAGVDPNGVDKKGNTPLIMAAYCGSAELVHVLLEAGADPNKPDRDGWTPLMLAIHLTNVEAVNALILGGANVDKGNSIGRTPLLTSAAEGKTEMVELLLSHGANVDLTDENKSTALMEAAEWGHLETVKVLLAHKASPSLKNVLGLTAWDLAEKQNRKLVLGHAKGGGSDSAALVPPKVSNEVAPKITPQMPGYPSARKASAEERTDPLFSLPAPIDLGMAEGEWDVAETLRPIETAPDKRELNRLYAILAMGDDKTPEKKGELLDAVGDYVEFLSRFPGLDLKIRIFVPLLRELCIKGIVSHDIMLLVHEKDLKLNQKDYRALSDMGQTFMAEKTDEGRAAAEGYFNAALKHCDNPKDHAEISNWLAEVAAERLKSGKGPKLNVPHRVAQGVTGLMSVESVSDKDDDKGKR